jgi:hypothetical protein
MPLLKICPSGISGSGVFTFQAYQPFFRDPKLHGKGRSLLRVLRGACGKEVWQRCTPVRRLKTMDIEAEFYLEDARVVSFDVHGLKQER